MNYIDYLNWAEEYRSQEEVLRIKLENRKQQIRKENSEEQKAFDCATRIMYMMKLDCGKIADILERKARRIKEHAAEE